MVGQRVAALNIVKRSNGVPIDLIIYSCLQEGLVVTQSTVCVLQQLLDPAGVNPRRRHRLVLRRYWNNGPNQTWHMDGYDKMKPFAITVSGCVDGYYRNIIWLARSINNQQ